MFSDSFSSDRDYDDPSRPNYCCWTNVGVETASGMTQTIELEEYLKFAVSESEAVGWGCMEAMK